MAGQRWNCQVKALSDPCALHLYLQTFLVSPPNADVACSDTLTVARCHTAVGDAAAVIGHFNDVSDGVQCRVAKEAGTRRWRRSSAKEAAARRGRGSAKEATARRVLRSAEEAASWRVRGSAGASFTAARRVLGAAGLAAWDRSLR